MEELWLRAAAVASSLAASVLWLRRRRRRLRSRGEDLACMLIPQRGPAPSTATPPSNHRHALPVPPRPAAGWPFRRRGAENLRIEAIEDGCQVIWRLGDEVVAQLAAADETSARSLYAWLGQRFGGGAERLAPRRDARAAQRGPGRVVVSRRVAAARELALLARVDGGHQVVELVDGALRSTAHVLDPGEGRELIELLADPTSGPPSDDSTDAAGRLPRTAAAALAAVFD